MSKYFQIALVLLYVLLTIVAFEIVLLVSGWRGSRWEQWAMLVGWVGICFGSAYVRSGVWVYFQSRFRKPLLAEENRLLPAMDELLRKAGTERKVRVQIDETRELNACATGHHTIAVTKGMLDELTPDELRGVLAHELGHLLSGDTLAAAAFATAGLLPLALFRVYRMGAAVVRAAFLTTGSVQTGSVRGRGGIVRLGRVNLLTGLIVLLILGYGLYRVHLLNAVVPVIVFVVSFSVLNRMFGFFARMLSRLAEYRGDAFAYRLGYGEGLRSALEKLAAGSEPVVNRYYIMMHGTHPVIYNRIRRLERLLDLT
jgi:Zn-dependent protease with chaperone function